MFLNTILQHFLYVHAGLSKACAVDKSVMSILPDVTSTRLPSVFIHSRAELQNQYVDWGWNHWNFRENKTIPRSFLLITYLKFSTSIFQINSDKLRCTKSCVNDFKLKQSVFCHVFYWRISMFSLFLTKFSVGCVKFQFFNVWKYCCYLITISFLNMYTHTKHYINVSISEYSLNEWNQ